MKLFKKKGYAIKPNYFFFEITSFCNFKCTFCPSEELIRKKSNLPFELGEKFLREADKINHNAPIQFNVLGEPFINNEIFNYLDLCKKMDHYAIIITNFSLLNEELCKILFSNYDNFDLVLSLQTPSEESFAMRGYHKLSFEEYKSKLTEIVEAKFKYKSKCKIEIHVASCSNLILDEGFQCDGFDEPWHIFDTVEQKQKWHDKFMMELEKLNLYLKNNFSEEYILQEKEALVDISSNLENGTIANEKSKVPKNMYDLTEDIFWGYMFAPKVFFRYKTFGLWTKEQRFIERNFENENTFIYIEPREGFSTCPMADNLGVLSNGEIVTCCLDYEGEINLGNIYNNSLFDENIINNIVSFQDNVLNYEMCRRCKGSVHIFDTKRLTCRERQVINHYALDWYRYEGELFGKGGRWSKACSTVYFYARKDSKIIEFEYNTLNCEEMFKVKLYKYSYDSKIFCEESKKVYKFGKETVNKANFDCEIKYGEFYKIEFITPTFCPEKYFGSDDSRMLGIAVFKIELL